MKKAIIKTISVTLVFVLSILAFSSCGWYPFGNPSIFPEGYTGGFGIGYGSKLEYYWVETYEETVEAMNLLKSHGSTFEETAIFSYEGDLFDTKYCFKIYGDRADYVKYGDNPYDRLAEDVRVESYAFFEDVAIDELVYSYVQFYESCLFGAYDYGLDNYASINISTDKLVYKQEKSSNGYYYCVYLDDIKIFAASACEKMSEECIMAMVSSVEFIIND